MRLFQDLALEGIFRWISITSVQQSRGRCGFRRTRVEKYYKKNLMQFMGIITSPANTVISHTVLEKVGVTVQSLRSPVWQWGSKQHEY